MRLSHISIPVLGMTFLLAACSPTPPAALTSEAVLKAQALGTSYFINNKAGSNCGNSSAGTLETQPWCDFTPANTKTFQPGDQILLARGATWFQKLELKGSGSATDWITLDAYGSGARPIIRGNDLATDRTIIMPDNPSYWRLQNLELSNAGYGIIVAYNTLGNVGLEFKNLYIHDIESVFLGSPAQADYPFSNSGSAFISFGNPPSPSPSQWVIKDVIFDNVEVARSDAPGLSIGSGAYSSYPTNSIQNVLFKNCYFHDLASGWGMVSASNVVIMDSRLDKAALRPQPQGTTGIFLYNVDNYKFFNNTFEGIANTNSFDMSAVDLEAYTNNITFSGNYISNNAGAGIETLSLPGRNGDFATNHVIDSNAFENNGSSGSATYRGSLLWINASGTPVSMDVKNNLYKETTGFASTAPIGVSFLGNIAATTLYAAAPQFSAVQGTNQWRYQYFNGSAWFDIDSYDTQNQAWGNAGFVSRFNTKTDSCGACWIARAWVAPTDGNVAIRGRALKNDTAGGDGVKLKITKNGVRVWPVSAEYNLAYNDRVGTTTNLDLMVNAQDVLRFEVNNGGSNADHDIVSWTPAVAYVASAPGNPALLNTSFESPTTSGITYSPSGGTWTFDSSSGVQRNGSLFGAMNAPDGAQTAFLQGASNGLGSVTQTILLAAGTYQLQFQAARRGGQVQPIRVSVDGTQVGTLIAPSSDSFTGYSSANFTVNAGTHTLKLEATDGSGDKTSFVDAVSLVSSSAPVLSNAGFEAPATGGYQYLPTGAGWDFSGTASGVQRNGSAFGASNAPEGVQTAFLQGTDNGLGVISQSLSFSAGSYTVSFQAARRPGQVQPIRVSIDGTQVGALIIPSSDSFTGYSSATFTVTAGTHAVRLEATDGSGDNTSFIDSVIIQ